MKKYVVLLGLLGLLAACAAKPVKKPRTIGMSVLEAQRIVSRFESSQSANEALQSPKSLDDVLAILKRDQIDLFPKGVEYAAGQEGVKALVLYGQTELAWGEAQAILAEILADASLKLSQSIRRLDLKNASGKIDEDEKAQLERLRVEVRELSETAEALARVAPEHVAAGAKAAREVIDKHPEDYVGYRLAADYYRMRGEWKQFDDMVTRIETANPKSNGLIFLRGAVALQRDDDPKEAIEYLRTALKTDPEFTRAQVHMVLAQDTLTGTYDEYKKLEALNPNHQIVKWAGPAIEEAFTSSKRWKDSHKGN